MKRSITTVAAAFFVTLAFGTIAVALNDWFGSGDLVPFTIYCVPFALLAAPATTIAFRLTIRLPVWLASIFAFIAGLLFGWLGTFAVALILGPWFGAMSVPMLQVWCIAAAFIFSAGVLLRRAPSSRGVALGLVVLASLSVFVSAGFRPTVSLASGNQHLTVFYFRHHPGEGDLTISDAAKVLDAADIAILKQTGLRGTLESRGSSASNSTKWPLAKALMIFTPPLTAGVSLPQPKHCTIAYVQEGSSFRRVPADAPTFPRQMHIEQESGGWQFVVEQSSGARSGGSVSP
jgi:hypothetical protein